MAQQQKTEQFRLDTLTAQVAVMLACFCRLVRSLPSEQREAVLSGIEADLNLLQTTLLFDAGRNVDDALLAVEDLREVLRKPYAS